MNEDINKIISKYKMYMRFDRYEYEVIQKVELIKVFEEIERLHSIIKEVREYVDKWENIARYKLLEMLDKE